MPIVNTNFIAGRMNKSVDERLLPPGEYVDAVNVRLGSTENTEIGAVENSRGNTQLTTLEYGGQALSSQATCLGAFADGSLETMYWFVHDPLNPVATNGVVDMIVSYETTTNQLHYHVITLSLLNFDPKYLITGVSKIENLLFFTDGKNPPRRINVTSNYPFPVGNNDQIVEEDISVILKPPGFENVSSGDTPLPAPTFELFNVPGGENYLEDKFISFAYRYRYVNGEYSATSLFTLPAFQPGNFKFNTRNYDNEGMQNAFNAARINFSTGSSRVTQVDLLYKDSNTNSIYVIERFKKSDYGWADNITKQYIFTNSKIYSVLGADELLRLYDNVPLIAQAQTIMGNRLIYGNYTDGYDIVNKARQDISLDYSTKVLTEEIGFQALPAAQFSQGPAYTINPSASTTVANSVATFDLANIQNELIAGSSFSFQVSVEHADLNGTTAGSCWADNNSYNNAPIDLAVTIELTANYANVYDFVNSTDFQNAIGTIEGTNFEPIATADQGFSLTDFFNAALIPPSTNCAFTKTLSSITDATNQQGFAITASPGSTTFSLQVLAMKYNSTDGATPTDIYEYFSFFRGLATFTKTADKSSLHSNRDYETGIVYLDEFDRASTVLVSEYNTVYVPVANSVNKNRIQVTVNNYAPYWAKKYKFVVKPSKAGYETIYTNFFYTDPFSGITHFKLDGDNQQKVKTGDKLTVKRDTEGPMQSVVQTTVLAVEAQSADFLSSDQQLGDGTFQLAGLYMQLKTSNFTAVVTDDSIIDYGEFSRGSKQRINCSFNYALSYPLYTYDATTGTTENYTIPGGSVITIKYRAERNQATFWSCDRRFWEVEKNIVASEDYQDFRDFFLSQNVNLTTADDAEGIDYDAGNFVSTLATVGSATLDPNDDDVKKNATNTECPTQLFDVNFQFAQDVEGDINSPLFLCSRHRAQGCPSPANKSFRVRLEIVVQRASGVLVFETQPAEANDEIYYDASQAFDIVESGSVNLHQSTGLTDLGDQNQTTSVPAIVTLDFMDCYTFGNGVESYKYLDRIEGRSVVMGQRALAVSQQDFKTANRFADMTYSGVYSSNAGINNLNEFNLGLANYKTLETAFGPIQKLHARETDILTLQEDKISYVLASKNIISDSAGGGAIVSIPQILGQQVARVEEYGISYNPESFAHYGSYFYFTDTKRSAVIELRGNSVNDQLTVVSNLGMRSWFRDQFNYQLNTQKLGGYDPYMEEFVLGTNLIEVPVPQQVYECGSQINLVNVDSTSTYVYDFGFVIGDATIDYAFSSGQGNISVTWNNTTQSSGVVSGSGSFTWTKSLNSPNTASISFTPSTGVQTSVVLTINCVATQTITVIKGVINSNTSESETIHVEYYWSTPNTISPVDSDSATLGANETIFSTYISQTGIRSQGVYPYDGVDLTIRTNKINYDDYNWSYPSDNFRYLSSNTLYQNNPTDVAALLAASTTIPNGSVTNPSPDIFEATVSSLSLPIANQYLYLIYDLRDVSAQQLCYDATSADDACCLCTWTCTSFLGSQGFETGANVCNAGLTQTYYHNGPNALPELGNTIYTSSNCEDALSGVVNYLNNGYYKISNLQYVLVGNNGLVLNVINC